MDSITFNWFNCFNLGRKKMSDKVKNYITVQLIGGSEYVEDIAITDQEAILLDASGNMPFQKIVWDFICQRLWWREGIEIQGNFNLISKTINGITTPLH